MSDRETASSEHFDRYTSASICNAIGERLRQNMRPESSALPQHLQRLVDEMQRRDKVGETRYDQAGR